MNSVLQKMLWPVPRKIIEEGRFIHGIRIFALSGEVPVLFEESLTSQQKSPDGTPVVFQFDSALSAESYILHIDENGILICGGDHPGLFYGSMTLRQIIAYCPKEIPCCVIEDSPQYKVRSFMADMGRSIYSPVLLRHLIRLMALLKMNTLHLHLYDDELCGLKIPGTNFGSDVPGALSIDDLTDIIDYAKQYHIRIVPEIEAWAHVGSLVFHRPDLRGGDGIYHGSSFLFSHETFRVIDHIVKTLAEIFPDKTCFHFGLDEAKWFVNSDMSPDFSPQQMILKYYRLLTAAGEKYGKFFQMALWADHSGRPLPEELVKELIVEPWCYWGHQEEIIQKCQHYSNAETSWIAAAGESLASFCGTYHSNRLWAKYAASASNCLGINIALWGRNSIDEHLITLYSGAGYSWNPFPGTDFDLADSYEASDQMFFPHMYRWCNAFPDAMPWRIRKSRGQHIYKGFYWDCEQHGRPVSTCVVKAQTANGHDYLNESNNSVVTYKENSD